jgi:hypothetical protein
MVPELPRVNELRALIADPSADSAYFGQDFDERFRGSPARQRVWLGRERELQGLDDIAWAFLKDEARPYLMQKDKKGRGWQQLFTILNQASAYNFLIQQLRCTDVRFVPRDARTETPDQTLWATHSAFLNDASELMSFKERLPTILHRHVEAGVAGLARDNPANLTLIESHGGLASVINESTAGIVDGMYKALFGDQHTPPYAEPYVTAFCTAGNRDVAEHGLLSQWRAYGKQGGYAVAFDTSRLSEIRDASSP